MVNKFIKKSSKLIAVVLAITLAFSPLSYADITTFSGFQTAISDSTVTTIDIGGTITASGSEGALGTQAASNLTINGNNYEVNASSNAGIKITSATINNITFKNFAKTGNSDSGGAIYNDGMLIINGTNFSSNTLKSNGNERGGSAIYTKNSATTIINSGGFYYNKNSGATAFGGAIYNKGYTEIGNEVIFSSNSTVGNTKSNGGAIYNASDSTMKIGNNVLFDSNKANKGAGKGGAIANDGDMTIGANAHFYHNESSTDSGAIGVYGSSNKKATLTIGEGALFYSNKSNLGGAIDNKQYSITKIGKNAVFSHNIATIDAGGAIYNVETSTFTIEDGALFEENTSGSSSTPGGAIYNAGTMSIGTSTFVNNETNGQLMDIYNIGDLTFTIDDEYVVSGGTTTMMGGITNKGDETKGITKISDGVTLMIGYNGNKQKVTGATFAQKKVVINSGSSFYLNVDLTNNFKITDGTNKVTNSGIFYITGDGILKYSVEGTGNLGIGGNVVINDGSLGISQENIEISGTLTDNTGADKITATNKITINETGRL